MKRLVIFFGIVIPSLNVGLARNCFVSSERGKGIGF